MHSDLTQAERDEMMHHFRNGHIDVLVATDIVSRGIDIDDIQLVLNFDVPHDCEDYVHRIGRTARAGSEGAAITFVSRDDQSRFRQIEKFIGREVEKTPVPADLGEAPEYAPHAFDKSRRGRHRGGKGHGKGKGRDGSNASGNAGGGNAEGSKSGRRHGHHRGKGGKKPV